MSDLISRQAAMDAVRKGQEWFAAKETDTDCVGFEICEDIVESLKALPSADRPSGEWIHQTKFGRLECTECGTVFRNSFKEKNFCPNCGADMRGECHE